jgi:hypothetical protein
VQGRNGSFVAGLVAVAALGALAWWIRPPAPAPVEMPAAEAPRRARPGPCSVAGRDAALRRARDLVGRVPAGPHGVWVAEPVIVAPASLADAADDVEALGLRFTFAVENGSSAGVHVRTVDPGSRAQVLGLRADDVVRAVDGRPLRTFDDLDAALAGWRESGVACVQLTRRDRPRVLWVVRESGGATP